MSNSTTSLTKPSKKFIALLKFYHDTIVEELGTDEEAPKDNFPSEGKMKLRFTAAERKVTPARKMDERTAKDTGHQYYNGGEPSIRYDFSYTEEIEFTRQSERSILSYALKYWQENFIAFQVAVERTSQGVATGKSKQSWSSHYDYFGMAFPFDLMKGAPVLHCEFQSVVDSFAEKTDQKSSLSIVVEALKRFSPKEKRAFMVVIEELKPYPMSCSTPENQQAISRALKGCCGWNNMQELQKKLYPYG